MIGIYKITNILNGNCYIGQSNNIKRRWLEHRVLNKNNKSSIKRAIVKYGIENFNFEVLEKCSLDELNEREQFYINLYKPKYNRTLGGAGAKGIKFSKATIERLRKSGKRQWENLSKEQKNTVLLNNLTGPKKGHVVSNETREKLRKSNLGKKQSEETIKKRMETIKNNGKKRTNSGHKKKVICVETGEIFNSVKEAIDKYNLTSLVHHLKGRQKTCKGNHYKYL